MIRILHWCMDQTMTSALEEVGLTAAQGRLMAFLARRGPLPTCPKDVEAELHLSHPTVSGLLSRLEQKGFVELQIDPMDRRSKRIVISQRGTEIHERMHSVIQENESRIVRGFSPAERAQFTSFLQRAIGNLHPVEGCEQKEERNV